MLLLRPTWTTTSSLSTSPLQLALLLLSCHSQSSDRTTSIQIALDKCAQVARQRTTKEHARHRTRKRLTTVLLDSRQRPYAPISTLLTSGCIELQLLMLMSPYGRPNQRTQRIPSNCPYQLPDVAATPAPESRKAKLHAASVVLTLLER